MDNCDIRVKTRNLIDNDGDVWVEFQASGIIKKSCMTKHKESCSDDLVFMEVSTAQAVDQMIKCYDRELDEQ